MKKLLLLLLLTITFITACNDEFNPQDNPKQPRLEKSCNGYVHIKGLNGDKTELDAKCDDVDKELWTPKMIKDATGTKRVFEHPYYFALKNKILSLLLFSEKEKLLLNLNYILKLL